MPAKKILVALLIIIVAIGGFVAGLVLLRQRQDLEDEAAVPGGQATVSIVPESGTYSVGDTIEVSVYFNPSNIAISTVAVRLSYPFAGASPEITVSSVDINPSFISSADWTCPTNDPKISGNTMQIDIGCGTIAASGFTANTNVLLANMKLNVERAPATSPLIVRFDGLNSTIKRHIDNEDVLLIPQSTGSYTIRGAGTQVTETPTPTPTGTLPTTTLTPTLTPTRVSTISATPTTVDQLPDAGVSLPTMMGVGAGIILILAALVLAI